MPPRHFIVPGSLDRKTGGSIYDRRITAGMGAAGAEIIVHELPDDFPTPSTESRDALKTCLGRLPRGSTVIIDGLISGCVPEILSREAERLRLVSLLHHPLADETGLSEEDQAIFRQTEKEALSHVSAVIVTSGFTKQRLEDLFRVGSETVFVVPPGTDPSPVRRGGDGQGVNLLCVASLTRRKGYPILIEALSGLREMPWRLVCVGSATLDPRHADEVDGMIADHDLTDRIVLKLDLSESELSACYDQADVFVLPSHYEGYGMVIAEALARALPIVTTTGGALRHTAPKPATIFARPGDVASFREALRRVLGDADLRQRLTAGAGEARLALPTWEDAATQFLTAVREIESSRDGARNG